ncbi:MAG: sulfatase [Actinomycetota bacterium]|nr:sulfatase [Actinomycetota bacterium]
MESPHVILITCHDLGHHLGCYGVESVSTPAMDALAATGVRFERSFCVAPQCSPSRATLATGRYPHSNGVMGLSHGPFGWELNPDERHAASLFTQYGYETHLFGLQHVTQHVERLGFDRVHSQGLGREVATKVASFLRGPLPENPLYIEINFFEPHRPYDHGGVEPDTSDGVVIPPYLPKDAAGHEEMAALQGAIREVDGAVGIILEALDDSDISESTLLIFTVDHGIAMPRAKCTLYDPGLEIALIVRWPVGGIGEGRTVPELVSNVDVLPTLLEAAGAPIPSGTQGYSFLPLLRREPYDARDAIYAEKTFHSYYDPMRCIRTERYKYVRNFEAGFLVEVPGDVQEGSIFRSHAQRYSTDRPKGAELYDLRADPLEQNNLAGNPEFAGIEKELDTRLWSWMKDTGDPLLDGPVASPVYRRSLDDLPHRERSKPYRAR